MRNPLIVILPLFLLVLALTSVGVVAQTPATAKGVPGAEFSYLVFRPPTYDAEKTYPIVLVPGVGADTTRSGKQVLQALAGEGWVVIVFERSQGALLPHMIGHLRRTYRIESQRFFLPLSASADLSESKSWSTERPSDFHLVEDQAGESLATLLAKARSGVTPNSADERAAAAVLDDFHDCASKADGPRYFDHFAPQGVFLGTDASERWSQAEFRAWGGKYFERDSAWIYVPQRRSFVIVGDLAWFDESLHSDSYGACRGTGALRKIDGVWKIAQYHLSVPVPNALLGDVVTMVRNADKRATARGVTTVFVVRHAEKIKVGKDPLLTKLGQARAQRLAKHLASVAIDVCYTTQFKRTQKTAEPTCRARGIEITVLDARVDVAARILTKNRGQTVLVTGHSNTVPGILRKLGVRQRIRMTESDYGDLFVVTIDSKGRARLLRLLY
ncbi:MAG: nuclear transport factor 2 family protein [Planctomycetota bacterium]|nr:nuclear transport factor 2 family protein [Planctomycetota bacterium]